MIFFVIGSILFNVLMIWVFKWSERFDAHRSLLISINYIIAATLSFLFSGGLNLLNELNPSIILSAAGIGLLFVLIFNFLAIGVNKSGVTPSVLAQKTSVALPVVAGILFFQESLSVLKVFGLLLTFPAIYLSNKSAKSTNLKGLWVLAVIFLGSGLIDVLLTLIQSKIEDQHILPLFVVMFGTAAIGGLLNTFIKGKQQDLNFWPSTKWGVVLGGVNFLALFSIIKSLNAKSIEASMFFPINNLGIIIVGALGGFLFFGEKLLPIKVNILSLFLNLLDGVKSII